MTALVSRRALRGYVIHVVRPWRERKETKWAPQRPRAALSFSPHPKSNLRHERDRRCVWCRLSLDENQNWKANFHPDCVIVMYAAKAVRATPYGLPLIPEEPCPCGAKPDELDHIVPLALAAQQGLRAWLRAFLPPNLQWLCQKCHRRKTREDVRMIADAKAGRTRMMD